MSMVQISSSGWGDRRTVHSAVPEASLDLTGNTHKVQRTQSSVVTCLSLNVPRPLDLGCCINVGPVSTTGIYLASLHL